VPLLCKYPRRHDSFGRDNLTRHVMGAAIFGLRGSGEARPVRGKLRAFARIQDREVFASPATARHSRRFWARDSRAPHPRRLQGLRADVIASGGGGRLRGPEWRQGAAPLRHLGALMILPHRQSIAPCTFDQ